VLERHVVGEVMVEHVRRVVPIDPTVVDAVRKRDEIPGEPVAADMGALPGRRLVQLLADRLPERTAVARAARVVLPVRADEEERLVDRLRGLEGIELAQLFVVVDLEAPEALAALP
jgi:hypothetical protein